MAGNFDRLHIRGTDSGHLSLHPMAEPGRGQLGDVYLDEGGVLRVHNGTEWTPVSDLFLPEMLDSLYYDSTGVMPSTVTSGTFIANRLYAVPIRLVERRFLKEIGVYVSTASTGNVRFGVYGRDGDGKLGDLLVDIGATTTNSSGALSAVTDADNTELIAGRYFLAAVFSATPTINGLSPVSSVLGATVGGSSMNTISHYYAAHIYGALPTAFPAVTAGSGSAPRILFSTLAALP